MDIRLIFIFILEITRTTSYCCIGEWEHNLFTSGIYKQNFHMRLIILEGILIFEHAKLRRESKKRNQPQ